LCQNFKAIGEEISEIVSCSTASSPDIDLILATVFKNSAGEISDLINI
jgi:hypothetical protein